MIDSLTAAIISICTTSIGSIVSWILARRKYNSEVDNTLIENMSKSLEFYKSICDDTKARLDEILKMNSELEIKNEKLEKEVKELKNQMINFMAQICLNMTCELRNNNFKINGNKGTETVEKE